MSFNVYPDAATAALLAKPEHAPIALETDEVMRSFVPLADHVGPDPALGNVATTFIRIALSGIDVPDRLPTVELIAHDPDRPGGSPAQKVNPNIANNIASAVTLHDDVNSTGAALAYFSPPFDQHVWLLKVVIEIPGTRLWVRITNDANSDPDAEPVHLVWVVADNDEETRRPWIHVTYAGSVPAQVKFDAVSGQTAAQTAQPVQVNNLGTGPLTVTDVSVTRSAPFVVAGIPIQLGPNAKLLGPVTIGLNASNTLGDMAASAINLTGNDPGPFGAGHNNQVIITAQVGSSLSNTWRTMTPMPHRRGYLGMAAAGGKLYAIGGQGGDPGGGTTSAYDPLTNSWTERAPMSAGRTQLGVAVASNGKIYAVGGGGSGHVPTMEEYDPVANSWSIKKPLPTGRSFAGVAAARNGRIYVFGGNGPGSTEKVVEEYDPSTDNWATKQPMPTPRSSLGAAAAGNGKIYVIGGTGPGRQAIDEYDPATNSWATKAAMSTPRDLVCVAAGNNGKIYVFGGTVGADTGLTTVDEYDPSTDSWLTKASMAIARFGAAAAAAGNGRIYVVGGFSQLDTYSTLEQYTL